ncbi:hypothetical protein EBL87_06970 [Cereibacter sphaeroides]|uniref:hypothetical protein n=1 Tax=Cereibacter sphaeroides TaxID=1063 RepID=UPI000F520307|nr:hypothetical protein [Cereibacter sphaeroides]AZB63481.1 hypothetical protein EBL87_06970 [Cereibacter sphaeroides]AZB68599.1 hypothetical protein EBL86_09495 [Cereibacter sphaeroides]
MAVGYVFLRILPELSAHQPTFSRVLGRGAQASETWAFLVGLAAGPLTGQSDGSRAGPTGRRLGTSRRRHAPLSESA